MCFVYRFSHTRDECDTHDECVGLVLRVYSLGLGVLCIGFHTLVTLMMSVWV